MCQDCVVLHEKLKEQSHQMWQMKRTIINLRGELKYERKVKMELIKEKKKGQRQNYRNGRKRGARGFNG